jgi:2-iminobutanoate/2-iminopropanoate deaminase
LLVDLMSGGESALLSETLRFCAAFHSAGAGPAHRRQPHDPALSAPPHHRSTKLNTSANRLQPVRSNIVNPPSSPISNALVAGDVIYTVQVPRHPQTFAPIGEGDIEVQAARVFDQLEHVLECAGSSLAHVAQMSIYLVDKADAPGMNRVYARYFTAPPYPNRATVVVKELLGENCLIEIVVQAIKA